MKSLEMLISRYWSAESQIREARRVFFDKGIIKRELLEDELAFAWLRCKYKNTAARELPLSASAESKRIPIKQLKKMPLPLNEIWIGLFDQSDQLRLFTGNLLLGQAFSQWDFSEAVAGYNGIGSCFESKKSAMTIGMEHYSDHLTQYVTLGLPFENQTIGVILPLQMADDETIERIQALPFESIFDQDKRSKEGPQFDCYFFRQDIQVFKNCHKQFLKMAQQQAFMKITAKHSYEAYLLAREIHKNSSRKKEAFVYLCEKDLESLSSFETWSSGFKGTVYIEDGRWLPLPFQRQISQFIDSKLINSKSEIDLYNSDIAIIISEVDKSQDLIELPELYVGLQMKCSKVNLIIPSFQDIGHHFKSYLYTEFEKLCAKRWQRDLRLSEEALKVLTAYSWPEQYKELIYLADYVSLQRFEGQEVPATALPDYLLRDADSPVDNMTLKNLERAWIAKALVRTKGNIKRTSEILGITRTTLYKKIEEYQL